MSAAPLPLSWHINPVRAWGGTVSGLDRKRAQVRGGSELSAWPARYPFDPHPLVPAERHAGRAGLGTSELARLES
jgi:hypothetical protein